VSISGRSSISGNVARNGGGVAVLRNAILHVSQGVVLADNAITAKGAPDLQLYVDSTQPVLLPAGAAVRKWGKKSVQAVAAQG
jgi:FAD/FMN-containing dehydrogenase